MAANYLALLSYVVAVSIANLMFNRAAINLQGASIGRWIVLAFAEPSFYAAFLLYILATLIWVWVLSRVTLSAAYPFLALPVIVVPALASYFFGDVQTTRYWLGAGMVALGVIVTQA
jgi:drug/metabolite transporter (DMT)-like permease